MIIYGVRNQIQFNLSFFQVSLLLNFVPKLMASAIITYMLSYTFSNRMFRIYEYTDVYKTHACVIHRYQNV